MNLNILSERLEKYMVNYIMENLNAHKDNNVVFLKKIYHVLIIKYFETKNKEYYHNK